jgi:hypothetical protein
MLLQPKLDARENSLVANKMLNFINCFTSHANKMLKFFSSPKDIRLTALDLNRYDGKNIGTAKMLKLLSINLIFSQYLNLISDLYLVKNIVHAGLEWYLYTNMQAKQVYNILYLAKKNYSYFFLCHIESIDRIATYFGSYLSALSINLKSVKCNIYNYLNKDIYLGRIEYVFANSRNCLYRPSRQSVADLIDKVKQKLYHKNIQGHWRASHYICTYQALLSIEKILQSWLSYYSVLLGKMQVLRVNQIADYMFYKWQVK